MKTISMTPALYDYLLEVIGPEPQVLSELRAETSKLEHAMMQVPRDQGLFMGLLAQLMGVRQVLEVGVFTGYSSLAVALALPEDGRIIACDVSEAWTRVARRFWEKGGVAHKIDLRLAPARDTLQALLDDGQAGSFDMAFIDADKAQYDIYYEQALTLLRPGGVVLLDNMLWGGAVIDATRQDADTLAIRALNKKVGSDPRVSMTLLPLADGVLIARKR
ncbi:MAG TPA: class I SAM-dependent methyltransferase [Myxococcota bacterium]|nr:class I SAM-dependent methyltransferase [Myxococcota bacterium]